MSTFAPPPLSSHQGLAEDFMPPPLSSHVGPVEQAGGGPSIASDFAKYSPVGVVQGIADGLRQLATGHNPFAGQAGANEKLFEKAKESFHQGDYTGAAAHFLNYLIPGGAGLEDAGEDFQSGDIKRGLAKTAGIATTMVAGAKGPQILHGAGKAVDAVTDATHGLTLADPVTAINRAYAFTPNENISGLPGAIADIKAAETDAAPITSHKALIDAIPLAKQANRSAFEAYAAPARARGTVVHGAPITAATVKSIPDTMWIENPESAQRIIAGSSGYAKPLTVPELEQLLKEKNAELDSFYSSSEGKQNAAVQSGSPKATVKAQVQTIRDLLYNALDPENGGAGPREIQKRYGALTTLEDAAKRRTNAIGREAPVSTAGQLVDMAQAGGKALKLDFEGAVSKLKGTDSLVRRAFANADPSGGFPTPAQVNIAGQLPAAPLTTPPPADTSFVRGVPAHEPFRVGLSQKALPAAGSPAIDDVLGSRHGDVIRTPVLSIGDLMRMKPADFERLKQQINERFSE